MRPMGDPRWSTSAVKFRVIRAQELHTCRPGLNIVEFHNLYLRYAQGTNQCREDAFRRSVCRKRSLRPGYLPGSDSKTAKGSPIKFWDES